MANIPTKKATSALGNAGIIPLLHAGTQFVAQSRDAQYQARETAVASIRVMFVTPDTRFFARVQGLLYARPEVRLFPECIDAYRPLVAVRRERPDVVLIDAEQIGDVAVKLLRRISALNLSTRTLAFHTSLTELRIAHVLQCGGAGCLSRDSSASDIIRAAQAVVRGELWASRKVVADVLQLMRAPGMVEPSDEPQLALSKREREIATWMRRGMSNKEIGRVLGISDMTVKTHAHNIFHKLEISGRRLLGVPLPAHQAALGGAPSTPIEPLYRRPVTLAVHRTS